MRSFVRQALACVVLLGPGCGGRATSVVDGKDGGTGSLSPQSADASADGGAGQAPAAAERDASDGWSAPSDAAPTDNEPADAPVTVYPCESPQECTVHMVFGPQIYCCIDHVCIAGQGAENEALACDDPDAQVIQASNYDQSCATDSDCVPVAEGTRCHPGGGGWCPTAAIRTSALAQYQADVFKSSANACIALGFCPNYAGPCCHAGTCRMNQGCVASPADTLPACADAGGSCSTFSGCGVKGAGPPDSCAYSDEMCCLD